MTDKPTPMPPGTPPVPPRTPPQPPDEEIRLERMKQTWAAYFMVPA